MHILLFDKTYTLTYWVNYSEVRARLRRRYAEGALPQTRAHVDAVAESTLAWRLAQGNAALARAAVVAEFAPQGAGPQLHEGVAATVGAAEPLAAFEPAVMAELGDTHPRLGVMPLA